MAGGGGRLALFAGPGVLLPGGLVAPHIFEELVQGVSGRAPDAAELESDNSYGIASRVELPAETKQALLELRSEPERLRMLGNALRALITAVSRSKEIAERAKMNGKVIVG